MYNLSNLQRFLENVLCNPLCASPKGDTQSLTVSPSGLLKFHPQLRHDGPKSSEPLLIAKNASFNLATAVDGKRDEDEIK